MYEDLFDQAPRPGHAGDEPSGGDRDRYDDYPTDAEEDGRPGFFEHLDELRTRALRGFLALVVAFLGSLFIGRYVVNLIEYPARQALAKYARDLAEDERQKLAQSSQADATIPLKLQFSRRELIQTLRRDGIEVPAAGSQDAEVTLPVEVSALDLRGVALSRMTAGEAGLKVYHPLEPLLIYLKACLITAVVLVSPYLFYQVWQFTGIWLPRRQRRMIYLLLPLSVILFLAGAGLCFFYVFPRALGFLFMFNRWMHLTPDLRLSDWVSFGTILPLVFGFVFELPLVMLVLDRTGILDLAYFRKHRKMALLVLWLAAGFVVPEPVSQTILGLCLYGLYELGIVLIRYARSSAPRVEAEAELTAV